MQTNSMLPGGCRACVSQPQLLSHAAKLIVFWFLFETEGRLTLGSAFKEEGGKTPIGCMQTPGYIQVALCIQAKIFPEIYENAPALLPVAKSLTLSFRSSLQHLRNE